MYISTYRQIEVGRSSLITCKTTFRISLEIFVFMPASIWSCSPRGKCDVWHRVQIVTQTRRPTPSYSSPYSLILERTDGRADTHRSGVCFPNEVGRAWERKGRGTRQPRIELGKYVSVEYPVVCPHATGLDGLSSALARFVAPPPHRARVTACSWEWAAGQKPWAQIRPSSYLRRMKLREDGNNERCQARFHGVMVSTQDSESCDPSSNLGGT